jgi:uncharacterized protein
VDADKYTARAQLNLHDGYVIWTLPGSKVIYPVQACLYIDKENLSQYVHNLIIAEEGAELHVITGCAVASHLKRGLHVGISEFFITKNAKLSFTMIHNWAEEMMVRPHSVGIVEEGDLFLNNYICMRPLKSLQMYPTSHLVGRGAVSRFYSLLLKGGLIHAIPELQGKVDGVEMSHEAAVGKIAQEEIQYLMSRGLAEDEATSTIVRGFLSVNIPACHCN